MLIMSCLFLPVDDEYRLIGWYQKRVWQENGVFCARQRLNNHGEQIVATKFLGHTLRPSRSVLFHWQLSVPTPVGRL